MIEVKQLTMTSEDRPTQWKGLVGDSGSIYIRYRRGELEVYVSKISNDAVKQGDQVFNKRIGGNYDGRLTADQMKAALAEVCRFAD